MSVLLGQHQKEIESNLAVWRNKPLLRDVYAAFHARIAGLIDHSLPGLLVEIGSGIGNLKSRVPAVVCTDLFPNPWLDLVCDGYELPFRTGSVSHLVLLDVFHHLEWPAAFLREAQRVLHRSGRILLFEPYLSVASLPVYALLHHEPAALRRPIDHREQPPATRTYYAAQGNATRLFFRREGTGWPAGWRVFHAEALSDFSYLLSGGFSKPALYPRQWLGALQRLDALLSRWPRLFAARCLVGLERVR